jgi:hypothetical protein
MTVRLPFIKIKGAEAMRFHTSLVILLLLTQAAAADEISCSSAAVDSFLKADWQKYSAKEPSGPKDEKVGIVPRYAKCPPMEQGGMLEYMDSFQLTPVDEHTDAILIDTHQCGGGNKHGQYFLISRHNKCDVITKPEIGDMAFIAENMYANDRTVVLKGIKWTRDDPHCCPSSEGTLEYNVDTGQYVFNLHKIKQR